MWKKINPVEVLLNRMCGECTRKAHRAAVNGREFKDKTSGN